MLPSFFALRISLKIGQLEIKDHDKLLMQKLLLQLTDSSYLQGEDEPLCEVVFQFLVKHVAGGNQCGGLVCLNIK